MSQVSTPSRSPLVWIVVLNWNGIADTLECLRSLEGLRYLNTHIVVVDNGSRVGDVEQIGRLFPHVSVLRHESNRGYTGGNNAGIEVALRRGAEYVWLLNNDTTVDPDCLAALVAAGEQDPRVGLLSPVIYRAATPRSIQFCGTFLDRRDDRQVSPTSLEEARVAAETGPLLLWGTAILLKRGVVETIGLLDDRYFAYHEDLDYSLRANAAGFEARVIPEGVVVHKTSWEQGSADSPLREYLFVRNWYLLWHSHPLASRRYRHRGPFVAWAMDRALEAKRAGRREVAEHGLDGIWDALRGRWGSWETKGEMPTALKRFVLDGLLAWHPYAWLMLIAKGPLETLHEGLRRRRRDRGGQGPSDPRTLPSGTRGS